MKYPSSASDDILIKNNGEPREIHVTIESQSASERRESNGSHLPCHENTFVISRAFYSHQDMLDAKIFNVSRREILMDLSCLKAREHILSVLPLLLLISR